MTLTEPGCWEKPRHLHRVVARWRTLVKFAVPSTRGTHLIRYGVARSRRSAIAVGLDRDSFLWHVVLSRDPKLFHGTEWSETNPPPLTPWAREKERYFWELTRIPRFRRDDLPSARDEQYARLMESLDAACAAGETLGEQSDALQAVSSVLDTGSLPPVPASP